MRESKGISLINTEKLIANKELSDFINIFLDKDIDFIIASNLLVGDIASYLNKNRVSIFDTKLNEEKFLKVVESLKREEISFKIFKDILSDIMESDTLVETILNKNKQLDSEEEIISIINTVLEKYPESVLDYQNGKDRAFKFLMGMIMKESKGKASPSLASRLLRNILDKK